MTEQQLQKWEQTRKAGPWNYAIKYGTVWGIFVGFFVFIANSLGHFDKAFDNIPSLVIMFLIYWVTGVIIYRFIFWRAKERVYQTWKNNS